MIDALPKPPSDTSPQTSSRRRLKILSYNVHSCIGTDRRLDPARIADVISELKPDIIGLQELDVGRSRTGGVDQVDIIAREVEMNYHFHAALHVAEERYGDAILTSLPLKVIKADMLSSIGEQRGAVWVEIDVGGKPLQVFNTHLGLRGKDRMAQMTELTGPDWLGGLEKENPARILIGDFNSTPITRTYRHAAKRLTDVQTALVKPWRATFPSRFPLLRLDHIFVSDSIKVIDAEVISTPLTRRASDHLPLLATIEI
ncbi:endonuclease/exonuclease/phosphatase family protein [Neorhizobium sp. DAR64872/K0K18]|uniref:endonuclease/exonuclease/phosphatase family protein n=1 Tax=Neorhizobium sp. DAR64872/K0K18 TaxID=3421958 RepID=UPI003D27ED8F